MRFEKWQALGNDYIIVEDDELPFPLTAPRIKRICAGHFGIGSDGILLLSQTDQPDCAARLRIFNPDGSEAELSGNGAREVFMYLYNGGCGGGENGDQLALSTAAGPVYAKVLDGTRCSVRMARARTVSDDFPGGAPDGRGTLSTPAGDWDFQHVQAGNPQCAIAVATLEQLQALDLPAIGPSIEHHELFPNRTNVSWYVPIASGRIRARIFERGVGETSASGTGATGAAVAYVLAGGSSPVTVVLDGGELEVKVSGELDITLTGWALPVFKGELSESLVESLQALE
jgi:diaminopimelate epimerase